MQFITRRALCACAATFITSLIALPALAQSGWPDKPVRFIVPYTPGGATDAVTRLIAQKISDDTRSGFLSLTTAPAAMATSAWTPWPRPNPTATP